MQSTEEKINKGKMKLRRKLEIVWIEEGNRCDTQQSFTNVRLRNKFN